MTFDPSKPFEIVSSPDTGGFDPSKPFEVERRAPATTKAAPKDVTAGDVVSGTADAAKDFFGGFNEGLIGYPIDLVNAGLDKVLSVFGGRASSKPFLGTEWLRDYGFSRKPDSAGGRVTNSIGEVVGGTVLPTAALTKAAAAGVGAAARAPGFVEGLLAPYRAAPMAAAAGDMGIAAAAGLGGGIAGEMAPDSPTAKVVGQLVGGFSPALYSRFSPAANIYRGGKWARENFGAEGQAKYGREQVRDLVGTEMTPAAMKQLDDAAKLSDDIPGFSPSVAEATGAPGLVAQQRQLEAKLSGPDLDRIVARRRQNTEAVDNYAQNAATDIGEANPVFVIDAARGRVSNLTGKIETKNATVQADREALAARAFPRTDRAEAGGTIREQMRLERQARRERLDVMSRELGLDDLDVTAPFKETAKRLAIQFGPKSAFDDAANVPDVLKAIQNGPERVTFNDLKSLRERVSDDLIDAVGSANPSARKVRTLTQLKEEVDTLIDGMARTTDPTLASRYADFRRAYFDDYIAPFEQGAAYKVRSLSGKGFYKTTDEKVAEQFFKAGDTTAADQFNTIFANRPQAQDALRAAAIDSFRDFAVRDGVLDANRFLTWQRQHQSVLERFPSIRDALRDPVAADLAYVTRQAQLGARQRTIQDQMLSRAVASFERGGSAEGVIDAALKDPRKMSQLVGAARRADGAMPALRRTVWDKAVNGDAEGILNFIRDNRQTLNLVFDAKHLENIANIARARAMIARVPDPSGAAFVPRPLKWLEDKLGQQLPQLSSRVFAFKSGRMPKEYLVIDATLRSLRGRAEISADDALKAALYDPEVARQLRGALEQSSTSVLEPKGIWGKVKAGFTPERLQARLIALGIPLVERPDNSNGE